MLGFSRKLHPYNKQVSWLTDHCLVLSFSYITVQSTFTWKASITIHSAGINSYANMPARRACVQNSYRTMDSWEPAPWLQWPDRLGLTPNSLFAKDFNKAGLGLCSPSDAHLLQLYGIIRDYFITLYSICKSHNLYFRATHQNIRQWTFLIW